jgi:hypothetical protein
MHGGASGNLEIATDITVTTIRRKPPFWQSLPGLARRWASPAGHSTTEFGRRNFFRRLLVLLLKVEHRWFWWGPFLLPSCMGGIPEINGSIYRYRLSYKKDRGAKL